MKDIILKKGDFIYTCYHVTKVTNINLGMGEIHTGSPWCIVLDEVRTVSLIDILKEYDKVISRGYYRTPVYTKFYREALLFLSNRD